MTLTVHLSSCCRFISQDELAKLMGDDESIRDVIEEADKDGMCHVMSSCRM